MWVQGFRGSGGEYAVRVPCDIVMLQLYNRDGEGMFGPVLDLAVRGLEFSVVGDT